MIHAATRRRVCAGTMIAVAALSVATVGTSLAAQAPPGSVAAFVHANVLTMTAPGVSTDQTVFVEGGLIRAIGPTGTIVIPPAAQRIDATGRFLMPGLADFHTHFDAPIELLSALYHGVTTIAELSGVPAELKAYLKSSRIPTPRVFATGPTTDGYPPTNRRFVAIETAADAEAMVADQVRNGANFIKVYGQYSLPAFQAVVAAAGRHHVVVIGHIPRAVGAIGVLRGGQRMVAHAEEFMSTFFDGRADTTGMAGLVAETRKSGTYVTPNLSAYANMYRANTQLGSILSDPEIRYLGASSYHEWIPENNRYGAAIRPPDFGQRIRTGLSFLGRLTKAFSDAGVPLLLGTDSPVIGFPGEAAHVELEELQASGLTAFEALRAGTSSAGLFLRETVPGGPPIGTVTPGAAADLVLLESNPLANVANARAIIGVMVAGRWLPRATLASLRDSAAAPLVRLRAAADTFARLVRSDSVAAARALFDRVQRGGYDEIKLGPWLMDNVLMNQSRGLATRGSSSAVDLARMNLALHSQNFASYNLLGDVQLTVGDTAAARTAFAKAAALAPYDASARHGLERSSRK
jgi:imidazolonepropionase-like amidohydrolase